VVVAGVSQSVKVKEGRKEGRKEAVMHGPVSERTPSMAVLDLNNIENKVVTGFGVLNEII
jgi:hypothetical protein